MPQDQSIHGLIGASLEEEDYFTVLIIRALYRRQRVNEGNLRDREQLGRFNRFLQHMELLTRFLEDMLRTPDVNAIPTPNINANYQ